MLSDPFFSQLYAFVSVVIIDLVLAGDNAIVVGMAASGLPREKRQRVIMIGIVLALLFRVLFALIAVQLLAIIGLLLAGGLLLLWVAWKMWRELHPPGGAGAVPDLDKVGNPAPETAGAPPGTKKTRTAIWQIAVADVSMSLDNVLAVAGAARWQGIRELWPPSRRGGPMLNQPEPFALHVPDDAIADLRERLARTRFPDQAPGAPRAYGTDVAYMEELVSYWRTEFDWRAQEARLNGLPQYIAPLHGIDVHFLHVPGKGPEPCPLILAHGWPGSVFEFLELIPRLADPARFSGDPADAFTVVAPSLPGFGLSFAPGQPRFGVEAIADCLADLMTLLGYERFAAQGGDWGAFVASRLGYAHAERMIGIHLNLMPLRRDPKMVADPTPEERRYLDELTVWLKEETGYQWIQGTRPQTLAFALTDSPAGLGRPVTG